MFLPKLYLRYILFICVYNILAVPVLAETPKQKEQYISSLLVNLEENNRTVEELSTTNLTNLPVGIKRTIGNNQIIIGIDSAKAVPGGMLINAYTQVQFDGTSKKISFEAKHLLVTPSGISSTESSRLAMITRFEIPINEQVSLILPDDGRNYIEWDCKGFKSVNLKGYFEFSGQTFIPDPELSGNKQSVTAAIEINTTDLNNIIANVSITPFRIKGLGDMAFAVTQATVDMSDYANSASFVFPANYQNNFNEVPELWRGFFLKDVKIYLPSELSSDTGRTVVEVNNLLIDESGISGNFSVSPVLSFEKGNASGWPFSVDKLGISITQNNLTGGLLTGKIGVPFLGNDTLGYSAQIESSPTGLQYFFSVVTPNETREFQLPFGGALQLHKGCVFNVEISNGKFIPSAILNGSLLIRTDIVHAEGLRFEQLHLTTESPYILGGKFTVGGGVGFRIVNFNFCIDSISLGIFSGKAALEFNVYVGLMDSDQKGIAAMARFQLNASVHRDSEPITGKPGKQHWAFDGVQVKTVAIDCELSIFTLKGRIDIYKNDPVYGNGFHGAVEFTIKKLIKEPVSVEIYFGTKEDFKYWFVKVSVPVKIPIGTVTLEKLTGGAYNRMKRLDLYSKNSDYVPDRESGLGFIAGVGLSFVNEKLIYAEVELEIAFNRTGGLRFIRFQGDGQFFSGKKKEGDPPVKASICMIFDNENDVFHANVKVYLNIAGVLTGIGPDGLLGECVIHKDPHDWYIYIGRPSVPLGINIIGLVKVQSYFMAGTKIEDMPLPPAEVAAILGGIDLNFMKKENTISTGKGVAFGIRFNVAFGFGRDGGFVYAFFDIGAGADVMLRDYGDAECYGRSGPIGIDGWYASGQAYTYLQGKLGIRVKGKEFDIMSVAAAMLMQAKLPNPAWFKGYMAARYKILGGLVKGSVSLTVTMGEECIILNNGTEIGAVKVIGDIKPSGGSKEVDVFSAPQVAFNTGIDKEFGMVNVAEEYHVYRVKLDELKLVTSDNQEIKGTLQWNADHDLAAMKLPNILPGNENMKVVVKVHIEKKTPAGWQALTSKGIVDYEDTIANFVTGEEPTNIPENNIVYTYPVKNQYNFYKNEYPKGYIKLGIGQPNLFRTQSDGKNWEYKARFRSSSGTIAESDVTYNENDLMVNFDIPAALQTSETYTVAIIKKQKDEGSIERNLKRGEVISTTSQGDTMSITNNKLAGAITMEGESDLHSYPFRSSLYSTFNEKLNNFNGWHQVYAVDVTLMSLLGIEASMSETFDKFETTGQGPDFPPLVYAEAIPNNNWINNHVNPKVYELYNTIPGITLNRNTDTLGLFPSRGMRIFNFGEKDYTLQNNQTGDIAPPKNGNIAIRYYIPHYVYVDFCELRNKAASLYLGKSANEIPLYAQRLLTGSVDDIYHGPYPFKINYRLPGLNTITTSQEFKINY
jgi:hypothetical protein